jgi:hypothetical protein
VNRQQIRRLLDAGGHVVAYRPHPCRFGHTWQPTCIDCAYVGPYVSMPRAQAIAAEHRLKSVNAWEPAR